MNCVKIFVLVILNSALFVCSASHEKVLRRRIRSKESCPFDMCARVPDYPVDEISNIVETNHVNLHTSFAGAVLVAPAEIYDEDEDPSIEATSLCTSKTVTVRPRKMVDIDGITRVIPNVEGFPQVIKYEKCQNSGETCPMIDYITYKFACVQKFADVKLLTVNVEEKKLKFRKFRVPTACVCEYSKRDDFMV